MCVPVRVQMCELNETKFLRNALQSKTRIKWNTNFEAKKKTTKSKKNKKKEGNTLTSNNRAEQTEQTRKGAHSTNENKQ